MLFQLKIKVDNHESNFTKSEQTTEGSRRFFRNGDCKVANRICCDYTVLHDGELQINESEAKTVRWIFERYLAGDSLGEIATGFERMGVVSSVRKVKWSREAISKVLFSEIYTGSVLLQKTTSVCGIQFKNDGEVEKVSVKNHHDAIISAEQFEQVQKMRLERARQPGRRAPMMTELF